MTRPNNTLIRPRTLILATSLLVACLQVWATAADPVRPPSVPLVACDPYFSIWSSADQLTDADTVHWTGKPHRLFSDIRIDGKIYRVLGIQDADIPALPQQSVNVLPTRTIYGFAGEGIQLTLTFLTPALSDDLEVLSRPVTYVSWEVRATDGREHEVGFRFSASGELAVNTPDQQVEASELAMDGFEGVRIGSVDQAVLAKRGDDIRIDWGYFYLAVPSSPAQARAFILAPSEGPNAGRDVTAAIRFETMTVTQQPVSRWLMLAYDDLYSIQYMKQNLRPYWRRNGWEAADLLAASAREYDRFDRALRGLRPAS